MTTTISIRTDSKLKERANKIFQSRGLNMSTAFNMYLSDVVSGAALPTSNARYVPDHIMEKWEKERLEALKSGKRYKNSKDLIADLLN